MSSTDLSATGGTNEMTETEAGKQRCLPMCSGSYWTVQPPSTVMAWPVMLRAASLTRKATIP